jgi:hypothetical protein
MSSIFDKSFSSNDKRPFDDLLLILAPR